MFDETLNGLIKDKHLILRAEYLDVLKYLCMKRSRKGMQKTMNGSNTILKGAFPSRMQSEGV